MNSDPSDLAIADLDLAISRYRLAKAGRPRANPRPIEPARQAVVDAARRLVEAEEAAYRL